MTLVYGLLIIASIGAWWHLSQAYEATLRAAKVRCDELDVQFLDDSVIRDGYRLNRGKGGSLQLVQKFRFEFSTTGDRRYQGKATTVGTKIQTLTLEPHQVDF